MAYDLVAWSEQTPTQFSRSQIYCFIAEDVEVPGLGPVDASAIEAALDAAMPGWTRPDAPLICDVSSQHVSFAIPFSRVAQLLPQIEALAQRLGLSLFDPQSEDVPAADVRSAKKRRRDEQRMLQQAEAAALRQRADSGDAQAQLLLANQLAEGKGARAKREAFQWYRRAAEAGNADAAFNLAACLQYGDGCTGNIAEAIRWYHVAAEKDTTYAPFALGEIYLGWPGVSRDNALAASFFQRALQQGHPDAQAAIALLAEPVITLEMKKRWKFWNPRA